MDYSFEPEIEKLNVSCIINGVVDNAVLELQEDNDCRIILTVGNNTYSSGAEHFWGALTELRKQLEEHNIKLLCQGCCMNVYPSPMILDMGDARKAYKMKLGYTAKMEDLVFIFDPCDPDDYASMKEVVHRRYTRLIEEEQPLPDLIIADGGKGQMEIIRQVIQDELNLDIPIAGLAKDDRHRTNELLYGFPPMKIALKVESELFHVLTQIQDEVHRFKRALHSEMDDIKGIGPKTRDELLNALKSVKKIREAELSTLSNLIGPAKAKIVYQHFHPESLL